jgi:signal transduction histidine kinase
MEDRQQKTRNLVEVAHGIVTSNYELEKSGKLSHEDAQARAKTELRSLRYDKSEYFWINDMTPVMVMCRVSHGHIPVRSWPLFRARDILRTLINQAQNPTLS